MKIALPLFFILAVQVSFAQRTDNTLQHNASNVYFQAIDQYLQFIEKEDKKTDTLFLTSGADVTDSILSECRHTKLVKLDSKRLKNLLRKRASINLYRIQPLQVKDGKFAVVLIPFGCEFDKASKKFEFLNGGKYIAVFTFDGLQYKFEKLEEHGI